MKPRLPFAAPWKGFHGVGPNYSVPRQCGSDWKHSVLDLNGVYVVVVLREGPGKRH